MKLMMAVVLATAAAVCAVSSATDFGTANGPRHLLNNPLFRSEYLRPLACIKKRSNVEDAKQSLNQLLDQLFTKETITTCIYALHAFEIIFANDHRMLYLLDQVLEHRPLQQKKTLAEENCRLQAENKLRFKFPFIIDLLYAQGQHDLQKIRQFQVEYLFPLALMAAWAAQDSGISRDDIKRRLHELLDQLYETRPEMCESAILAIEAFFDDDGRMLYIIDEVLEERRQAEEERLLPEEIHRQQQLREISTMSEQARALLNTNEYASLMYRLWKLDPDVVQSQTANNNASWLSKWIPSGVRKFWRDDSIAVVEPSEDQLRNEIESVARTPDPHTYKAVEELIRYQFTQSDRAYIWLIEFRKAYLNALSANDSQDIPQADKDILTEGQNAEEVATETQAVTETDVASDEESRAVSVPAVAAQHERDDVVETAKAQEIEGVTFWIVGETKFTDHDAALRASHAYVEDIRAKMLPKWARLANEKQLAEISELIGAAFQLKTPENSHFRTLAFNVLAAKLEAIKAADKRAQSDAVVGAAAEDAPDASA